MKLTKEIIRLFKYHGFMTITSSDEDIVNHYHTVEELADAGFINDPEALRMAKLIFDSDGVPVVGPTKEADVMDPLETVKDPEPETTERIETEPVNGTEPGSESVPVGETTSETESDPVEEPGIVPVGETTSETESDPVEEPEPEPGTVPVEETVTETVNEPEPVKEKKTTTKTTKKTTKKES